MRLEDEIKQPTFQSDAQKAYLNVVYTAGWAVFGNQAKSFIDEEGMTPSVATVQAFAHIASYHSLGAEHNLGWLYIGMALRCAIARECVMPSMLMTVGLNTECTRLLERGHIPLEQAKEVGRYQAA